MKFFIYSRKSVYTGKGESIENQIEMCKQYIHSKYKDISNEDITVYEDEGFSAKNTDRPQFQQMLKDMAIKKPDCVVCYRLDRISRSVSDFSSLIEDFNDRNISFVCIKEEFDTSTPMGKAMMYIASVFAQLERETIAERVRDNMLMLARTGRWLGGPAPTGYTPEKTQEMIVDGKIKTACQLKVNPDEFPVVKTIYEKYLELRSVSGVSKYLISQGIKSRNGKLFSLLGIKDILQNPVYSVADEDVLEYFRSKNADVCFEDKDCSTKNGLIAYNKRDYKKKHAPRQSVDKWIISIGKHKGCVSGKAWVAVQNIIAENIPTGKKPARMLNNYSLLSGLIYCDKCESRMFAKPRRSKRANHDLYDYICNNKLRGGLTLCDSQNINGQKADDEVCKYLINYADESSAIYQLLETLKQDLHTQTQDSPAITLDQSIKKCNDEMDKLVNVLSQENLNSAFIQRVNTKIAKLDEELFALTEEQTQRKKIFNQVSDKEMQIDMIVMALSSLKNNFDTLSIYEKRTLIKLLVKKIVWDGKELHIFIYGE